MEVELQSEKSVELTKPQKTTTFFDQHLEKYETIFQEAYERVMFEAKDEIDNAENFVLFVVRAMHAVKDANLHGLEKKDIVVDIVHKVVDTMPICDEEKATLKARTFPAIEAIIEALVYAAKGYMYLKHINHEIEEAMDDAQEGCARCQVSCVGKCRGCRRHPGQATKAVALRVAPVDDEHLDLSGMVDEVYDVVKTVIRHKKITLVSIVSIGSIIMQVVEEYPSLIGYQKKHLVLRVAHRLVDELVDIDETTREIIKVAIDTTLDKTIDFIIKASRGEIEIINKILAAVESGCTKCIAKCC